MKSRKSFKIDTRMRSWTRREGVRKYEGNVEEGRYRCLYWLCANACYLCGTPASARYSADVSSRDRSNNTRILRQKERANDSPSKRKSISDFSYVMRVYETRFCYNDNEIKTRTLFTNLFRCLKILFFLIQVFFRHARNLQNRLLKSKIYFNFNLWLICNKNSIVITMNKIDDEHEIYIRCFSSKIFLLIFLSLVNNNKNNFIFTIEQ